MDRLQLITSLGLAADATDAQINAVIQSVKQKAEQLAAVEAKAEKDKGQRVKDLIATAVTDKKITSEEVPHYEKLATADYDSTAAILSSKPAIPKLSAHLNTSAKGDPADERKDWKIEDYLEKDPEALAKLEGEQPKVFARLNDAYFAAK